MGQITRCPLIGVSCSKPITIEERSFFLAEAEKPEPNRKRRITAINTALGKKYELKSAIDEKGINAFTCKICELIQVCAYGIADITDNNPNVLLELGMMMALGKPIIILLRRDQEMGLNLPSDLNGIEVIPFTEYIDIIDQFKKVVQKLPLPVSSPSPIQDLEKLQPAFAEEIKNMGANIVKEFKGSIEEAKLDAASFGDEKKELSPQLNERLKRLEEQLEKVTRLGFIADAETASSRAHYFYNRGDYEEAIVNLNLSIELDSHNPANFYNRGLTYYELGKHKEALADYNRSLELRLDDPATLNNRGLTYIKLGKHKEALADFNRSLELRPDDPHTFNNRGVTYAKMGKHKEALADYNRSLELRPDDPATLNNRGLTYGELGKYKEALADFNRSLELRPDDSRTLNNRGCTYGELGKYKEALADFNRSLELEPDDPSTMYNLACLFSLWGKADDASGYLRKAIELDKECLEDAKTDEDFDNIRDDPRFKKLIESE